jgi:hypothetical protein
MMVLWVVGHEAIPGRSRRRRVASARFSIGVRIGHIPNISEMAERPPPPG